MKEILTIEQIDSEFDKLSEEIDKLYKKQQELSSMRNSIIRGMVETTNDTLNVHNGVSVVAVAKHLDYHLSLIKVYDTIQPNKYGFEFMFHDYRLDDYDLTYRVSNASASRSVFHEMIEEYDLYTVDNQEVIKEIILTFSRLGIDEKSYKSVVESIVKNHTIGRITI